MDHSTPLCLRRFVSLDAQQSITTLKQTMINQRSSYCYNRMPNQVDYYTLSSFLILDYPLSAEAE
jgi:hypothetical protein